MAAPSIAEYQAKVNKYLDEALKAQGLAGVGEPGQAYSPKKPSGGGNAGAAGLSLATIAALKLAKPGAVKALGSKIAGLLGGSGGGATIAQGATPMGTLGAPGLTELGIANAGSISGLGGTGGLSSGLSGGFGAGGGGAYGGTAGLTTGQALAGGAALLAPLAIAYGMGTWKKGHGYLGNNRNHFIDYQLPGFKGLDDAKKQAVIDAGTKAGVVYTTTKEIDPRNPLAAQGRGMAHVNWQKYLQPGDQFANLARGIGGVSDTNSRWRNGLGNATEADINNASWLKPEKRAELLNFLSLTNGGSPTPASPVMANDKVATITRSLTKSPGIDKNGRRIKY